MIRHIVLALSLLLAADPLVAQDSDEVADARDAFVAGDYAAALGILVPAADAGHMRAQNIVGSAYQYGHGLPVDAQNAVRHFEMAAAQGYPPAMHNLGVLYQRGMEGLAPDLVQARAWYARGAALDYGPALSGLGILQLRGDGGPEDPEGALRSLHRAVELGDPLGHEWLAHVHYSGAAGLKPDLELARHYMTIAALQGQAAAQNDLGQMHERGEGGPLDMDRALELYRQAILGGHVYAAINAAWLIFDNPDRFPDRVEGLAMCFVAVARATGEERDEYAAACGEMAATFAPEDRRAAEKRAAVMRPGVARP